MDETREKHPAAVMFTDIVGYTAIMQESEELARTTRGRHREALESSVPENGGKVLQYFGDGSLSLFDDPIQAIEAGVSMQRALRTDPPVNVRIGIHFGDVSYDEQGVYGDSVNVAARIESLSSAGGIMVSQRVVDEVGPSAQIQTSLVGDFQLKNVRGAVRLYAVVNEGLRVPTPVEVRSRLAGPVDEGTQTFAADSGFEILRLLGEGMLGRVYLARETRLGRTVVVKMMRPELFSDPVSRKRFEREARSVAKLSHPNLATLLRVGEAEERLPFLVMEYVKGISLEEAIEAGGAFSEEVGRRILLQIASALASAHDAGIIHRNVKPANIIWDAVLHRAVLTDFGFVKILDDGDHGLTRLTRAGQVMGDSAFLSPEQLMGEPATAATDIFALGVLGYRLLAASAPFGGANPAELALAQLQRPPIPLLELAPHVDPALADVVERCLLKRPNDRPTGREVVLQLTDVLTLGAARHRRGASDEPHEEPARGSLPTDLGLMERAMGMLGRILGR